MKPHPITADLLAGLHGINQDHAVELSSLSLAEFSELVASTSYARAVGESGFMLTFDETADYHSPNYLWFRERYERFLYVDRIVISAARRGEGLARQLYDDLFAHAQNAGQEWIVAEVNSDPPNPGSDAFHEAMGFKTVGEARLADRGKSVRYVARPLAP